MGGSSVMFDVGSSFSKKRKRMKGTDGSKKVEIKQWNPRSDGEGDTYNAMIFINTVNPTYHSVNLCSSWLPMKLYNPSVGNESYQRVGKSYFLKYLRFKGYLRVENRCVVGCRWRLRLIRTDNYNFSDGYTSDDTAKTLLRQYASLLRNNQLPNTDTDWSVNNILDCYRHNYYKSVFNVDNHNIIKTKIIASGYVPVSTEANVRGFTGTLTGNSAGVLTLIGHAHGQALDKGVYYVPLDVKVKCNDYVNTEDIRYYLVLETDYAGGIDFQTNEEVTYSILASKALFQLNFFVRGYFTDL